MELYLVFHVYKTAGSNNGMVYHGINTYQLLNTATRYLTTSFTKLNMYTYATVSSNTSTTASWVQTTYSKVINDASKLMALNSNVVTISGKMEFSATNGVINPSVYTDSLTISLKFEVDYLNFKISSSQTPTGTIGFDESFGLTVTLKCTDYRLKNGSGNILTTDDIQTILDKYK